MLTRRSRSDGGGDIGLTVECWCFWPSFVSALMDCATPNDVPRMAFSCSSDSPRVLMLAMMELMKDDFLDDLLMYFFLS